MQTQTVPQISVPVRRSSSLTRYFYFCMSLLTVAVVFYGFSFTVEKNLIHPPTPRPTILYIHAAIFTGWLAFFVLQSLLVRTRNVRWHRKVGWVGFALGISVLVVGVATAIVMARFKLGGSQNRDAELFRMIPLFDMLCFATAFGLAILWRKRPDYHRRLILIATCALTAAGFGRFPDYLIPRGFFYLGVDSLILLGVTHDWFVEGRIHRVYRYALPLLVIGQGIVIVTIIRQLPYWRFIAHRLVG
jgi:hypothetical protein